MEIRETETELRRSLTMLNTYGRHRDVCELIWHPTSMKCTCGFENAVNELQKFLDKIKH